MRTKLIRNLKPGDHIKVIDMTRFPAVEHRVTVTRVQETRPALISGRRMWQAFFTPHLNFGSWVDVAGYSDDRIAVYDREPAVAADSQAAG